MPEEWQLRAHPEFTSSLYRVPRGAAAILTQAIEGLRYNPTPENSTPVINRPGRYELHAADYVVVYRVEEAERIIRLFWVEPEAE